MKRPEITREGDSIILCQATRNGRRQTIELEAGQGDEVMHELQKVGGNCLSSELLDFEEERQDAFGRL